MPDRWDKYATPVATDRWDKYASGPKAPPAPEIPQETTPLEGSTARLRQLTGAPTQLGHVASEAGSELAGLAKGMVNATIPQSPAEWAMAAVNPAILMSKKMVVDPTIEKGRSSIAAFKNNEPMKGTLGAIAALNPMAPDVANLYEQAKTDPYGAMGRGAVDIAAVTSPEWAPPVARVAGKVAGKVIGTPLRIATQEMAGAGKEPVLEARQTRAEKVAAQQAKYIEAVQKANAEHTQALAEHKQNVAAIEAQYAKDVSAAKGENVQSKFEARKTQAEATRVANRHEAIARGKGAMEARVLDNAQEAHNAARADLNGRWDALREKVGPAEESAAPIYNAIQEAKTNILKGSPPDIKIFKDLLNEIGVKDLADTEGGGLEAINAPGSATIDFDTARVHSSALGMKRFSGELPGNVKRAVAHVQDAVEAQTAKIAKKAGAGKEYGALKSDWSQYMNDWHNMEGIGVGGSPLARVFRAEDPPFVSKQVLGDAGPRLISTYAKYRKYGASPEMLTTLRRLDTEASNLPKVTVPKEKGSRSVKAPKIPEPPEMKAVERPQEVPEIDPAEIRRAKLLKQAGRKFGWWELMPHYLLEHLALKNPAFREWVATQPRQELPLRQGVTPIPSPPQ